jgi:hypothetical protein
MITVAHLYCYGFIGLHMHITHMTWEFIKIKRLHDAAAAGITILVELERERL